MPAARRSQLVPTAPRHGLPGAADLLEPDLPQVALQPSRFRPSPAIARRAIFPSATPPYWASPDLPRCGLAGELAASARAQIPTPAGSSGDAAWGRGAARALAAAGLECGTQRSDQRHGRDEGVSPIRLAFPPPGPRERSVDSLAGFARGSVGNLMLEGINYLDELEDSSNQLESMSAPAVNDSRARSSGRGYCG